MALFLCFRECKGNFVFIANQTTTMTMWGDFQCLHLDLIAALTKNNLIKPTPIQSQLFEHYPHYRDFLVAAQTGSGKTLAFAAPILSELIKLKEHLSMPRLPQCLLGLVLTPTRELAQQIQKNFLLALQVINSGKAAYDQLKVACIIGGMSKEKQLRILRQRKPQIIIGTPGRLHELLGEEVVNFQNLKYLVVDEADRMIEMGHFKEIDQILEAIFEPKKQEFFDKDFHQVNQMMEEKAKQDSEEFFIKQNGKKVKISLNINALPADQLFEVPSDILVFDEPQPKFKTGKKVQPKEIKKIEETPKIEITEADSIFLSKLKRKTLFVSATLTREFKGTKYFIKKTWNQEDWKEKKKERKEKRKIKEKELLKKGKKNEEENKKGEELGIEQTIPKLKALLSRAKFSDKPKIIDLSSLLFLPQGLKEVLTFTEGDIQRTAYIISYLEQLPKNSKVILFANTIKSCKRIQFFIESFGMETVSLHSHMQQKQRLKKLEKFKKSTLCNILIATDVAARGLDFNITHVIQMGVPINGDTYVHRAGRTARANRTGEALILIDKKESNRWTEINDIISETTPNRQVTKYQPTQRRFNEIQEKVQQYDWIRRNKEREEKQVQQHDVMDAEMLGVEVEEEAPRKKYDLDKEEEMIVRHQVRKRTEVIKKGGRKQEEEKTQFRKNRLVLSPAQIKKML